MTTINKTKSITAAIWEWLKSRPAGEVSARQAARVTGVGDLQAAQALSRMALLNRQASSEDAAPWPGLTRIKGRKGIYAWDPGRLAEVAAAMPEELTGRVTMTALAASLGLRSAHFSTAASVLRSHPEVAERVGFVTADATADQSAIGRSVRGAMWVKPDEFTATPLFGRAWVASTFGIPSEDVLAATQTGLLPGTSYTEGAGRKTLYALNDVLAFVELRNENQGSGAAIPAKVEDDEVWTEADLLDAWDEEPVVEAADPTVVTVGDKLEVIGADGDVYVLRHPNGRILIARPPTA